MSYSTWVGSTTICDDSCISMLLLSSEMSVRRRLCESSCVPSCSDDSLLRAKSRLCDWDCDSSLISGPKGGVSAWMGW